MMLEKERETLKANAEGLANLLTENVPYLLSHYLKNDVLTEAERENIIQADSSHEIRLKLVKTLLAKEGVSLEAVIDGLNATENHCVSEEIQNLLSELKTGEEVSDNGSGDKTEDLSAYATNLVDEVIAKAEKTTAELEEETEAAQETEITPEEVDEEEEQQQQQPVDQVDTPEPASIAANDKGEEDGKDDGEPTEQIADNLVKTCVEVHTTKDGAVIGINEENANANEDVGVHDTAQQSITADVNEQLLEETNDEQVPKDVPERSVKFPENVSTIIEDDKHYGNYSKEELLSSSESPTMSTSMAEQISSDQQSGSENEDVDDIDIEKEFVMPAEAERSVNNNNSFSNGKLSNDIILDDEKKTDTAETTVSKDNGRGNDEPNSELAAILARKALVRQQVELFEKSSPTPAGGKVKYTLRAATQEKEPAQSKPDASGSNVKNLKNFFQQLSNNENTTSSPSTGAPKSVGKLKVTFPASS